MSANHRALAEGLIAITAEEAERARANPLDMAVVTQAAVAHALLAVEARLGQLVEQLRVGNVIAAFGGPDEEPLIDILDQAPAETYIQAHMRDIVNPEPNGDI
ncbi:hypothetical protein ACIBG0_38800 [Nocardia sp. NPDC050630]|uniref:hypothetical protein n=1 Tax=Nocardia sp. NPDC050630 TaxID=3364321 RepID=UPI0037B6676D